MQFLQSSLQNSTLFYMLDYVHTILCADFLQSRPSRYLYINNKMNWKHYNLKLNQNITFPS